MAEESVVKGVKTKVVVTLTPPAGETWTVSGGSPPTYSLYGPDGALVGSADQAVLSYTASPITATVPFDSASLAVGAHRVSVMFPYTDATGFVGKDNAEKLIYVKARGST